MVVVTPIPGTPADRAGILSVDIITKIDGKSTKGMSSDKAINFLRGEVGKSVKLTVVRSGVANPIVFNIVRERIESETMSCEMLIMV
ncbi:hypothetical protein AGMMS49936_11320 [Endomicrobiia bacterium]|nr:hypothetical protein AGMMS49936_11320 [Endomicrobiia bacterium]